MPELDHQRQKQAKKYAIIKRQLWLVDQFFSLTYALLWLTFGWSTGLRAWLADFFTNEWGLVAVFASIFFGIYFFINLPLSYFSGFVLPHRYDLSTQTLTNWIIDQLKGLAVGALLGLLVLELIYLALRLTGDSWWLWLTAGSLVFSVLLSNLAPILIMPLFNKFTPLGEEHADLAERLTRLAQNSGTKVNGVYKMDMSRRTRQANAALMGIGQTRRIVLGDTLINEFSADEIETILAHELGHHVHNDIPWLITFGTLTTAISFFLVSLVMDWTVQTFSLSGVSDPASLPAFMILLSVVGLILMPIENAFSRWREEMADDYALESTGKSQAFASAFTRLANQNLSDVDPQKWVVFMFYNHPPLNARIAKAEKWGQA